MQPQDWLSKVIPVWAWQGRKVVTTANKEQLQNKKKNDYNNNNNKKLQLHCLSSKLGTTTLCSPLP